MLVVEHQPAFVQHQAEAVVPLAFCMEQHPRAPHGFKLKRDDVLFWPFWPRSQLVDQGGDAIKTGHIRSYRQKNLLLMTIMYHWGVWEPNQAAVRKAKRSLFFFFVRVSVRFNICFCVCVCATFDLEKSWCILLTTCRLTILTSIHLKSESNPPSGVPGEGNQAKIARDHRVF